MFWTLLVELKSHELAFLCSLKASRETLPMNALIVYILVENIKTGICVASEFELSRYSRNMLFDFGD